MRTHAPQKRKRLGDTDQTCTLKIRMPYANHWVKNGWKGVLQPEKSKQKQKAAQKTLQKDIEQQNIEQSSAPGGCFCCSAWEDEPGSPAAGSGTAAVRQKKQEKQRGGLEKGQKASVFSEFNGFLRCPSLGLVDFFGSCFFGFSRFFLLGLVWYCLFGLVWFFFS